MGARQQCLQRVVVSYWIVLIMEKIQLTDEQINHIAEKAAEVAFRKIYEQVGKSVVHKIYWLVGAGVIALMYWLAGSGNLKN
jgi:hypothetical protein